MALVDLDMWRIWFYILNLKISYTDINDVFLIIQQGLGGVPGIDGLSGDKGDKVRYILIHISV